MRRVSLILPSLILPSLVMLAACADAPPPVGPPQPHVSASFPPGGVVDVIKVDVLDREPLRTAELVAPDGGTTPASFLNVNANPTRLSGQAAIGDPWRPSMLSSNGNNPLPTGRIDPGLRGDSALLTMAATADITLPDPVAYRRDWAAYKIRLGFQGAGDQLDVREIPAPTPPPERVGG